MLAHQLRRFRSACTWDIRLRRRAVARGARVAAASGAAALLGACGGGGADAVAPAGDASRVALTTTLAALDPARDGRYEAWAVDAAGARRSLGRFDAGGAFTLDGSNADVRAVEVTLEPPGDADPAPAAQLLLRGDVRDGRAALGYAGALTQNDLALQAAPGQFTMFTPSDNATAGYPSHEEAGVWLFNMAPGETAQKDYYVRLTPLARGWTYEGWMVRDLGTPGAVWLSYGKFVPDWTGAVNGADDTGWGPFSGVVDFRRAQLEDFPGDDWVANPLGYPWPAALALPLDLRERDALGRGRWTHVITVEPATDRGEPLTTERPSGVRAYVDPFGDRGPGVPRSLTLQGAGLPRGTAELR